MLLRSVCGGMKRSPIAIPGVVSRTRGHAFERATPRRAASSCARASLMSGTSRCLGWLREDGPMGSIQGSVAPGFELVKVAFEENMAARGEVGAAVSVWHRGREVVNLAGGVVTPG